MDAARSLEVFELLERNALFVRDRHEVASRAFSMLRLGVRGLIISLRESGDEWLEAQVVRLHRLLAAWLTVPCSFQGDASDELISALIEIEELTKSWDQSVLCHLEGALAGAGAMSAGPSELQQETRDEIIALIAKGAAFKIYCHRTARSHFANLLTSGDGAVLTPDHFLHSPAEFRDCCPFEVLLKVGPLRSEGWGSAPAALLNAPKFEKLVQIVWSSTADDPNFGLDPVLGDHTKAPNSQSNGIVVFPGNIQWQLNVQQRGVEDTEFPQEAVDDLGLLSRAVTDLDNRRHAILLVLADDRGVLYPPNAGVLVFNASAPRQVSFMEAQVNEDVAPGMFIVWPRVQDAEVEVGLAALGGQYQLLWKALLVEELAKDSAGLVKRLRSAGLNLAHLESAARHWAKAPTTVVHAPQMKRHFDILMKVLGMPARDGAQRPAASAWQEVRRSRGEAIQAGVVEHSRLLEMSIDVLRTIAADAVAAASGVEEFSLQTPEGAPIFGTFLFLKVVGIEQGYRAPEIELRHIHALEEVVKWRT